MLGLVRLAEICQAVWQGFSRLADIPQAVCQGLARLADICQKAFFASDLPCKICASNEQVLQVLCEWPLLS
jgi:hypothetical protein